MPILDPNTLEFFSRSADQTKRIGMRLGSVLRSEDVVCLEGDMGSGKTTLVQGLASGWGSLDQVTSPTFVLVNLYRRPNGERLVHLDAYRLHGASDAESLDIDNLLDAGPLVVEWAPRIKEALPEGHLWIKLNYVDEEQRSMQFTPRGASYEKLLKELRKRMFGNI
jgi:tRNA threonylcarbamoyladenosine biosynthesis protein TsaE